MSMQERRDIRQPDIWFMPRRWEARPGGLPQWTPNYFGLQQGDDESNGNFAMRILGSYLGGGGFDLEQHNSDRRARGRPEIVPGQGGVTGFLNRTPTSGRPQAAAPDPSRPLLNMGGGQGPQRSGGRQPSLNDLGPANSGGPLRGSQWAEQVGLVRQESGGDWGIVNNEGYGGRLQFGTARLADAARAGLVPQGTTGADFARMSPAQQRAVEDWHFNDIDRQVAAQGLDRYIGQTVGGVQITPGALRGMAHLGGIGGTRAFLESGGLEDRGDSNGTRISSYGRRFGGGGTGGGSGPAYASMDPEAAAGYFTAPREMAPIELPDAPQRGATPARPLLEMIDRAAQMASMESAYDVEERDRSGDPWSRVQNMLAQAAMAAGQFDGDFGIGALISAAGGAAGAGWQDERNRQDTLNREEDELQRQARIALAQFGFDVDMANMGTRNENAGRGWEDQVDEVNRVFENQTGQHGVDTQEALTNSGIMQFNLGNYNDWQGRRDAARFGAAQGQIDARNQEVSENRDDARTRGLFLFQRDVEQGGTGDGNNIYSTYGISPEAVQGEPPISTNARFGAQAAGRGSEYDLLYALGRELVLSGTATQAFPDLQSAFEQSAATGGDGAMELQSQMVLQQVRAALQSEDAETRNGMRAQLQTLANNGYPVARIVLDRLGS